MIDRINFLGDTREMKEGHESEFYAYKKDLFNNLGDSLELKKGINVLFGNNGCGKSTLLRMLGKETFAIGKEDHNKDGWTGYDVSLSSNKNKSSSEFIRDQDYIFNEGRVNLNWNGAFNFYKDGTKFFQVLATEDGKIMVPEFSNLETLKRSSMGESTFTHGSEIYAALNNHLSLEDYNFTLRNWEGQEITQGTHYDAVQEDLKSWKNQLRAKGDMKTPTFLLDEPDAHLSFASQLGIWDMIISESQKNDVQLVVASHCPIPLFYKDANIISFEKGYDKKIRSLFEGLVKGGDFGSKK
ncbi:hypothetical protein HOD29_01185 [archaeon]|jgi:predicted ATPase|nr:hypothetical protein [archaeon]